MVELIEYVLIFGVSAGVAGAGLALVGGAMPGLAQVAAASKADQIAGAARMAEVGGGDVTLLVTLHGSSVSCDHGALLVNVDGLSRGYTLGLPCSFDFSGLAGECSLTFSDPRGSLLLEAAC